MALILSGFYGMFFAHMKPIEDPSENSLMLSSLAVTYVNLVIGAVSRIPEEVALDTLYPNLEKVLFDMLVIGANVLVILILLVQYAIFIYRFFKEWRKNPRWSFSCCLALLLPLNDLQQEVLGMAGKNVLKQQLKTGNVDMPSLSGALKESGAVSIELTILPEHPEETSGSPSEETETGRKKEGNTDKGTVSTGDEPKKQAMTRKKKVKQQLQIGNVNMSSDSGPLKRSGAERIVHASIHERPKKTRGSLNKERKPAGKRETNTVKVAFDKDEEPEKNRLPQDNLQQEIRRMKSKNPLKQQLQTGNVNTPSKSGALKKSGVVRIVHASIHERPKKTRGSLPEEKKAVEEKEKVAEKVAFDKGEEPEKKRMPQDNLQQEIKQMRSKNPLAQQLQTDNVNNPPASGDLKKKGAVDFILVTIHEQPKEACGSPSEERGTGVKTHGADKQVATNTPEEELEETHL
ncbi:uncharacterized protein LOC122957936 [Acropora millepora]|uniref:uncharacterized protein LOC122957936 n=1 Tax=Acropora millepora TaxID=45264 RepID=UPI001CF1C888|nr:uncharacterized protein LOC122957936 [Acropora millepora]